MKARNERKEIDGVRFDTTTLPPMRGLVLEPKILRIVAPIIANGLTADAIPAFIEAFLRYSDEERIKLALDLLAGTSAIVDGERIELTSEKALNQALPEANTLWPLLWWVIGFNFFPSGVADRLAEMFKAAMATTANPSTSQT